MKRKSSTKVSVKKKSKSKKKKAVVAAKPVVPQKVDIMDTKSYQIAAVVRDKRGVVQYAKVGTQLYDMKTLFDLHETGHYRFYTSDDGVIKRDVLLVKRKGTKCYFATEADWKKENNLDYLPQPELTKV